MRVTHTASNDDGAAAVPRKSAASKTSTGTAGGADAALIVVDVQNSFIPGGSLAVPNGDEIVPLINTLAARFENVVLTQDWHPANHISFASQHPGMQPFETIEVDYGTQVLWPDHCIQGSDGAALHKGLDIPRAQAIIRKGFNPQVDSYSAFVEADRKTNTGLDGYMRNRRITTMYVVGLATDFCVAWTAMDARNLGFKALVIEDACRSIDTGGSLARAWIEMTRLGVERIQSIDL